MPADYDVTLATKWKNDKTGKEGTRYQRIGSGFNMTRGISIRLDHAIVVVPGVTELVLFTPTPKDEGQGQGF